MLLQFKYKDRTTLVVVYTRRKIGHWAVVILGIRGANRSELKSNLMHVSPAQVPYHAVPMLSALGTPYIPQTVIDGKKRRALIRISVAEASSVSSELFNLYISTLAQRIGEA